MMTTEKYEIIEMVRFSPPSDREACSWSMKEPKTMWKVGGSRLPQSGTNMSSPSPIISPSGCRRKQHKKKQYLAYSYSSELVKRYRPLEILVTDQGRE
jgi:hypothetical protein